MRRGTPRKKLEMLQGLPMFAACSDRELTQILRLVEEIDMAKGAVLMKEGAPGRESFIIVEGEAEVTVDGTHLATLGHGSIVGEMSLIETEPRTATVTAKTPMRLLAIGPQEFSALLNHRTVATKLLQTVAGRLRDVQKSHVG